MHSRCLVCNATFPPGSLTEHLPVGRRVAYDPERGRLWVICSACGGWTLWPITRRWEAVDALEGIVTAHATGAARLLARTDKVALFRAGATDVIRFGATSLLEEAAWRYGAAGSAPVGASEVSNPFGPRPVRPGEWMLAQAYRFRSRLAGATMEKGPDEARRWVRYGSLAWRGAAKCRACGHVERELTFARARTLILRDAGDESMTPSLTRACSRCRDEGEGGLHLDGAAAEYVLRRVLARVQDRGVSGRELRSAAHLIELGGGPAGISQILSRYGRYVADLPRTSAVALRVLANDARERRMITLEAGALERRWREEEELAAIVDRDLTWIPDLEDVRRMLRRS